MKFAEHLTNSWLSHAACRSAISALGDFREELLVEGKGLGSFIPSHNPVVQRLLRVQALEDQQKRNGSLLANVTARAMNMGQLKVAMTHAL